MQKKTAFDVVDEHLIRFFQSEDLIVFDEIESGDFFHLDVYWVKPAKDRPYHLLLTNGMSSAPLHPFGLRRVNIYKELAMLLPTDWQLDEEHWKESRYFWPITLIRNMARYPHRKHTCIASGCTYSERSEAPFGDSPFTGELLKRSSILPRNFQLIPFVAPDGERTWIEILLACPVYPEELEVLRDRKLPRPVRSRYQKKISEVIRACENEKKSMDS